jgi:4-aminobutyrate aminotransferase-like enzyme
MGECLQQGLRKLAQRYSWIREVRGAGLFLGVDLAANPATRLTAGQEATRVSNDLRCHGVLVGATGRDSNVLKIRPPLTIARAEVDFLISALDRSIRAEA